MLGQPAPGLRSVDDRTGRAVLDRPTPGLRSFDDRTERPVLGRPTPGLCSVATFVGHARCYPAAPVEQSAESFFVAKAPEGSGGTVREPCERLAWGRIGRVRWTFRP